MQFLIPRILGFDEHFAGECSVVPAACTAICVCMLLSVVSIPRWGYIRPNAYTSTPAALLQAHRP